MARPTSTPSSDTPFDKERREFPRQVIAEEAEFLITEDDMRLPCVVVNISASGAKIACDAIPPSGSKIILFLKGGMSLEAVTTRYEQGALGLKFVTPKD
ncbi:MAG TPA: PilZ domain-containing protein [Rhizomicrobium sp.]|nr:PilZ domain-containing protein [Rhizomicrobium sp.]